MDSKNININISKWVPIGTLFIAIVLFFFQLSWYNNENNKEKLESYLAEELRKVHQYTDNFSGTYDELLSPFAVEMWKNDSLIFWNSIELIEQSTKWTYFKEKVSDNTKINIAIQLFDGEGHLDKSIKDRLELSGKIEFSKQADSYLKIEDTDIPISVEASANTSWINNLIILFGILGYMFTLLFLYFNHRILASLKIFLAFIIRILIFFGFQNSGPVTMFSASNEYSYVNLSVGDFILNLILLFFILTILRISALRRKLKKVNPAFAGVINGAIISVTFIYLCFITKGFVLHEAVNLNIDKVLTFNFHSIFLILGILGGSLLLFIYSAFSIYFLKKLYHKQNIVLIHLIGIVISGIVFYLVLAFNPIVLAAFLAAYMIMIDLFLDSRNKNVVWLIWWMIILSGFTTAMIYYYGLRKDYLERESELIKFYQAHEPHLINELYQIDSLINESTLFQLISDLPYPSIDKKDFTAYIQNIFSDNIHTEIELSNIFIFDGNNNSLTNDLYETIYDLNNQLKASERIGKFWHNPFENVYYLRYKIESKTNISAPFYLTLCFQKENIRKKEAKTGDIIVIKNDEVIYPSIPSISDDVLSNIVSSNQSFSADGYSVVIYNQNEDLKIISFKEVGSLIKPMSLFSYLFTLMGIIVFLMSVINTYFDILPYPVSIKINQKTTLRNKIQLGIIALIIFSFFAIGVLTAYYFKSILEKNENEIETKNIVSIIEATKRIAQSSDNTEAAIYQISNKITDYSALLSEEVNLFDVNGILLAGNHKIKILPWSLIKSKNNYSIKKFPIDNSGGSFATVIPLFYDNQPAFGYLLIDSGTKEPTSRSVLDFLSALLNVYVFLFLLAGGIAFAISNSITKPLATLADKLRKFKLGKSNEPLEWKSNDEIGTLIKDYNNLIIQLEESANIIAKTERDTAWREMAKQVAHEIKNPLTPMKLSIQYIQRAISGGQDNITDLVERVSNTLLEQINNLSEIANEFSNFAKMPKSNNEKVLLNDLVEAVHDLFRKREDMDIHLSEPITDLYVFADRGQLVRILNNLVKNAIQAIPTERRGLIDISLYKKMNNAVIEVKDNGIGIPDQMKTKVFTPNFTTKSSGTGLGLAISANIIDGFNGKIYFETQVDKGTSFFVEIPLMRLSDQMKGENRVILD